MLLLRSRAAPHRGLSFACKRSLAVTITQSSPVHPAHSSPLLEAGDALLMAQQATEGVKFVDASWFLGDPGKGFRNYQMERVAGASFFDIDKAADLNSSLPHMLPAPEVFAEYMSNLGISTTDKVVVYNQPECFSAARCWWTFKAFAHPQPVYVLNGGLHAWKEAGGEVECGPPLVKEKDCDHQIYPSPGIIKSDFVADKKSVLDAVTTGMRQICDARSQDRFLGRVEEPRPGLEAGHIPGSLNLQFSDILVPGDSTRFKDFKDMRTAFDAAGVVSGSKVIFTCGSGVTAAVLALGRNHIGAQESLSAVYDGSWSEWGSDPNTPKMKE